MPTIALMRKKKNCNIKTTNSPKQVIVKETEEGFFHALTLSSKRNTPEQNEIWNWFGKFFLDKTESMECSDLCDCSGMLIYNIVDPSVNM